MGAMEENRKPLVVLAAAAVLAVLVLVLGVGQGLGANGGDGGWQRRLGGGPAPAPLRPTGLTVTSGACSLGAVQIAVTGACVLGVPASGGTLSVTGVGAVSANGGSVAFANNVVTYTPPFNFAGQDFFLYTVADAFGPQYPTRNR